MYSIHQTNKFLTLRGPELKSSNATKAFKHIEVNKTAAEFFNRYFENVYFTCDLRHILDLQMCYVLLFPV